ncbi:hypothetical protein [Pseudobacteriovorax antillogorgiicola]|uniref:Uncharacterized protein n=1 Tax=Pseudobacteriovorax antillogorgiicola TaxID=1513793 RepID=A0A1Y6BV41_9BACT|nr:hypothetical protein [Pseudobacteriovorax antillogorgiicola]TCS52313.1 hypothetical protein EDD56_10957 [Pseudobacteriovorax antillogorgiicola]SMF30191.1 hypothetical protein SAMN06296036_109156 [Pseudobacteriovorax antillogorgiicola]
MSGRINISFIQCLSLILSFCWTPLAEAFEISQLPRGKSVTLPRPALTLVPLDTKVRLTSTDRQQTIKLTSVSKRGRSIPFTIAIYDNLSEKVRYVKLKPGGSMVYSFRGMNTIEVVPLVPKQASNASHARLQVESNRPLGIGR